MKGLLSTGDGLLLRPLRVPVPRGRPRALAGAPGQLRVVLRRDGRHLSTFLVFFVVVGRGAGAARAAALVPVLVKLTN